MKLNQRKENKMRIELESPCTKCGCCSGVIEKSGPHLKLSCSNCNSYIKMVSNKSINYFKKEDNESDNIDSNDIVTIKNMLKEINFKLDVLLDNKNENIE
jgi:hypothetical protein